MKSAKPLILFGVFSALPVAALAQVTSVDTSKWQCKLCKFEEGASGSLEMGVGSVSEKSARFGDYTGLADKGAYFIGEASSRYRGADGMYWDVSASDIGLDSRSAALEGGRQGSYRLFLNSEGIPHHLSDTARTPFLGSGSRFLALPAGFPAGTTGLMPLATTLQPAELETKRTRLGLGASWIAPGHWQFDASYRRENRDGTKRTAGALFVNAAQLVEPVNTVTDLIDASASYTGAKLQAKFAYHGSRFRNRNDSLTWVNPFTPVLGGTAGQLALAPDNQFHQFSASVGYQFTDRTRASADLAWGRMTQNESFLAPTLNPALAVPALPGTSLNGRAKTLNANVRVSSRLTDQLSVNASYTRDDRDNQTPQAVYPWATTDMFLATPRTNVPYGFTQDRLKLSADYRFSARLKASAGVDQDWRERTFQEVDETRESTVWGKVAARPLDNVDLSLKLAGSERKTSGYRVVPWILPAENPLLRKYNMANRTRESAALRADIAATEKINVALGVDFANDSYDESPIGLKSGREFGLSGDVSVMFTEQTSLHFFANHQTIKSRQAGSQTFSAPDWSGENKDTVNLLGFGLKHAAIKNKLDLGMDYTTTRSRSTTQVVTAALDPPFPNQRTALESLKLYAIYRLKDNVSLHAGYWVERYRSDDWMLDGVAPATVPNLLAFGEQPPQYRVHLVRASLRFQF